MSGIIYTPPAGTGIPPDLQSVMMVGNSTTETYLGTGIGLQQRTVTGPIIYTVTDTDFLICCNISLGNIVIDLNSAFQNLFAIKIIGTITPGFNVRIIVDGGAGRIDGTTDYYLTRNNGGVLIESRKNGSDYIILSGFNSTGSVNSGIFTLAAFFGGTLVIPHNLNAQPTGVTVTPGDINASGIFALGYFVTLSTTNITINFVGAGIGNPITVIWSITRN